MKIRPFIAYGLAQVTGPLLFGLWTWIHNQGDKRTIGLIIIAAGLVYSAAGTATGLILGRWRTWPGLGIQAVFGTVSGITCIMAMLFLSRTFYMIPFLGLLVPAGLACLWSFFMFLFSKKKGYTEEIVK